MPTLPLPGSGSARLRPLFEPRSIAIVGASEDVGKVGGRVLESLRFNDFGGALYPVNPARERIQGLKAYPSIQAIGAAPELVILSVSAADAETQVSQACRAGAAAILVYASGFSEIGDSGRIAQERIAAVAREHGVVLVGPNCLGLMNSHNGLVASSTVMMQGRRLERGGLSFISQSGAIGVFWLDMILEAQLGVSKWVSTGNEADFDTASALDYLVDDAKTRVIGLYTEGVRDGATFRRALAKARHRGKAVIVLKAGRSQAGAAAVASHTGALAGDDALYRSLFEQYGVCQVDSLGEMVDVSRILATQRLPRSRRTCVVSNSGGAGALLTDAAAAAGLELPPLSTAVAERLKPHFPAYVNQKNPIDLTDRVLTDPGIYARTLEILMASGEFDIVFAFMAGRSTNVLEEIGGNAFRSVLPKWPGGHAAIWQSGTPELAASLRAAHVALFSEIPQAAKAMARALALAAGEAASDNGSDPAAAIPPVRTSTRTQPANEHDGKRLLAQHVGLASPASVLVHSAAELPAALDRLRFPVVAKLQSPDMLHKSGHGGIELNLPDTRAATAAAQRMFALAQDRNLSEAAVLVEEMFSPAFEFVVGLRNDPVLGPFLLLGRGGVRVEIQPDVTRAFLPLSPADIERMFRQLQMQPLLAGFRGAPPAPVPELARVIARLGDWFLATPSLAEVEINPLAVDASGNLMALDALVLHYAGD